MNFFSIRINFRNKSQFFINKLCFNFHISDSTINEILKVISAHPIKGKTFSIPCAKNSQCLNYKRINKRKVLS